MKWGKDLGHHGWNRIDCCFIHGIKTFRTSNETLYQEYHTTCELMIDNQRCKTERSTSDRITRSMIDRVNGKVSKFPGLQISFENIMRRL